MAEGTCDTCGGRGGCQHCLCMEDGYECRYCSNDPADDVCQDCGLAPQREDKED